MVDYRKELNEQQYRVVRTIKGPILVLAGAGSGKTRTLTYRVNYLIEQGVSPKNILLLTFSNKAAREMILRTQQILGRSFSLTGGTFHHVGNLILRRYALKIGRKSNFTILDREDEKILLRQILKEKQILRDSIFPNPDLLSSILSLSASTQRSVEEIISEKWPQFLDAIGEIKEIIKDLEERKREINALSFDDLLLKWLYLVRNFPEIKGELQNLFRFILVDEFQDTNRLQYLILKEITQKRNPNLMVVGDDAQSIYSFRGAEINNILNFPKEYPNCKIFKLERNYRSTKEILSFATEVILRNSNQFEKYLKTGKKGNKPILFMVSDERVQARRIAYEILRLTKEGIPLNQISVLFRAGFESLELELELSSLNIPYIKRGGLRFFETAHIKDILAFLKVENNILDESSWRRILVLKQGIGVKTADKIISKIKEEKTIPNISLPPSIDKEFKSLKNLLLKIRRESEIDKKIKIILDVFYRDYLLENFKDGRERVDDVLALISFAVGQKSLNHFLDEVHSDESFRGEMKETNDFVILSTIHQAKGLEWDTVIILDVLENYLPNRRALEEGAIEEERRLFYVALTRAKNRLYLFSPINKKGFGGGKRRVMLSRFVREIPQDLYEIREEKDDFWDIEKESWD
ncbi:ATP-dependent helicase [bacterium]|nr:ATP-dependent helicase [bacterium]